MTISALPAGKEQGVKKSKKIRKDYCKRKKEKIERKLVARSLLKVSRKWSQQQQQEQLTSQQFIVTQKESPT